ncbi:PREDICTED: uncharacterized protein LOC109218510 [Nicotiana attenuata]|uniref:uncharacterized protein LOC109218510 n=1 Tax=Nicotiana attenuata TaxID=49451 RepID=UPI0009046DBE|nr:PREDICTED: uncharacterized protein LOC109218510 [Nicotiana attenuata]
MTGASLPKKKLQDIWKITEKFPLIDLGKDYYTVKLAREENMTKILHNGPWFINEFFLSIQKWVPNFVAKEAHQNFTAVWVCLPQLPTEFYDGIILSRIGNCIGKLLKVDACTSATLRGRYARLCVELPLDQPIQNYILIGQHKQPIQYEVDDILCKTCGKLGHISLCCTQVTLPTEAKGGQSDIEPPLCKTEQAGERMTVSFPRKGKAKVANQQMDKASANISPGINVRMYDVVSDFNKLLQSDLNNEQNFANKNQVAKQNDEGESSQAKLVKQHKVLGKEENNKKNQKTKILHEEQAVLLTNVTDVAPSPGMINEQNLLLNTMELDITHTTTNPVVNGGGIQAGDNHIEA